MTDPHEVVRRYRLAARYLSGGFSRLPEYDAVLALGRRAALRPLVDALTFDPGFDVIDVVGALYGMPGGPPEEAGVLDAIAPRVLAHMAKVPL